ncbi:flagellar biosynthesis anti-sigma factor FlgM [Legionella israelensis]|uniref:Flagellin synthesis negative regulator n=1 Tax=Legionella israelensis TaxID=454 RepID=A0A0W0VK95_9GAMM|nr:flagellar biosynthesis anti-sigma factor FlgM [Legionella israelensis]KTD20523.1 flagellin synthesis negative regulator [Legionella israelensis]QBS10800.1 hypothetical protein E4T55_13725 [Legionella israelensis]QDP72986.1 flagellar biosynthesis anti-sigma factor FlgM [Legionella israelensis]SCX85775.1 negative regulator of flagellin synthesis FlgM [Legionella israelensis DSM 19235]STX57776.1 negative regulator of flagellin synthesis FlgM [Legionella israelensis]
MENVIERNPMVDEVDETTIFKSFHSKKQINFAQKTMPNMQIKEENTSTENASGQIEALKAYILNALEVDHIKVSHFKTEIQSGRYKINSDTIASQLLTTMEFA